MTADTGPTADEAQPLARGERRRLGVRPPISRREGTKGAGEQHERETIETGHGGGDAARGDDPERAIIAAYPPAGRYSSTAGNTTGMLYQ